MDAGYPFVTVPPYTRDRAEWDRHRHLLDELRAVRAPRLMIFVDTMNVLEGARELPLPEYSHIHPDRADCIHLYPRATVEVLEDFPRYRWIRAYWYDATVSKDRDIFALQAALHDMIRRMFFCELVLGARGGRAEAKREKGVDVALAVDMVQHAFLGNYDCAALVSGDEDFVPAVQAVKATGKQVICSAFTWQLAKDGELIDRVDKFIPLEDEIAARVPEIQERLRQQEERGQRESEE